MVDTEEMSRGIEVGNIKAGKLTWMSSHEASFFGESTGSSLISTGPLQESRQTPRRYGLAILLLRIRYTPVEERKRLT